MPSQLRSPANEHVERQLSTLIGQLEQTLVSDVLVFVGDIVGGVDDVIREIVELRKQEKTTQRKLTVIITTLGGYIEVVQRIVDTLRHHYIVVDFVVPNYAYSAGTVLVMSGDAIHMDWYSRLGPIDPQVETREGRPVPALGYLKQWERLLKKAQDGTITLPEVQLMLQRFDQAELYRYEQARELSCCLLEEWLTKYKFKNWKVTRTRGLKVNSRMRKKRAREIAEALSDSDKWHVHGYGISMEVLEKRLNLIIDDFSKNPRLRDQLLEYQHLLDDYMRKMSHNGVIQVVGTYRQFA